MLKSKKIVMWIFLSIFIINVTYSSSINFTSPTLVNNSNISVTYYPINFSISTYNLSTMIYSWNGTNYSFFDANLILKLNFQNLSTLGESNSLIADTSNKQYNVTPQNLNLTIGRYGNGYYFNGSNTSFINRTVLSELSNASSFTISVWIKADDTSAVHTILNNIISSSNRVGITLGAGGLNAGVYDGAAYRARSVAYSSLTWNNIIMSYNQSNVSLYLNGVLATGTSSPTTGASTGFYIGRTTTGLTPFNGTIDEFQVWNVSYNADQVSEIYRSDLQKLDMQNWTEYINQSVSSTGSYNYSATITDNVGASYSTETRIINLFNIAVPCTNAINSMAINGYTILCKNTYYLNGTGFDGAIKITNDSVILDGNGSTIYYGNDNLKSYAIYGTGRNNITIQNINIIDGGNFQNTSRYAVYFKNSTGVVLNNMSITTYSNFSYPIYMQSVNGSKVMNTLANATAYASNAIVFTGNTTSNTVVNTTAITNGSSTVGIYFQYTSNSVADNNSVYIYGASSSAIHSELFSVNNNITNNKIFSNGSSLGIAIFLELNISGNRVTGNTINTYGNFGEGIALDVNSSSNFINGNTITTQGNNSYGVYLLQEYAAGSNIKNNISANTIATYGTNANAIRIGGDSNNVNNNNFEQNYLNSYGAEIFLIGNLTSNNSIHDNYYNSSISLIVRTPPVNFTFCENSTQPLNLQYANRYDNNGTVNLNYTSPKNFTINNKNFVIQTASNTHGGNITILGDIQFTMLADIIGLSKIHIQGFDSVNKAKVKCLGGCFK